MHRSRALGNSKAVVRCVVKRRSGGRGVGKKESKPTTCVNLGDKNNVIHFSGDPRLEGRLPKRLKLKDEDANSKRCKAKACRLQPPYRRRHLVTNFTGLSAKQRNLARAKK